jgi:uncharacterized paraquat-inducible protein A
VIRTTRAPVRKGGRAECSECRAGLEYDGDDPTQRMDVYSASAMQFAQQQFCNVSPSRFWAIDCPHCKATIRVSDPRTLPDA